jgi:mannosyltransferase
VSAARRAPAPPSRGGAGGAAAERAPADGLPGGGARSFQAGRTPRSRPSSLPLLVGLIVIGGLLRWVTLDAQSYWADEAVTVHLLHADLLSTLRSVADREGTPPLYYIVAWAWTHVFGTGEAGLRSLSALLGTAAIPAFYGAAAALCSRRVALAVAALASVNPLLIWYSQEARAYALLSLLAAVSVWAFARALDRPGTRRAAIWAGVSVLALATHYFAGFLVAAEGVWLLAARRSRRSALPAVTTVTVVGLALLQLANYQSSLWLGWWIRGTPLPYRAVRAAKQYVLGYDSPFETALALIVAALVAVGVVVAVRGARSRDRRGLRIAGGLGAAAVGVPFVLAVVGRDYFDVRNLIAGWLPLAIFVAGGLVSWRRGRLGAAAVGVLCAIEAAATLGVALQPSWQRDDWRGAAAALGSPHGPRALVVQPENALAPLSVYLDGLRLMPAAGTPVREVAFVATVVRSGRQVHPAPPPRSRPQALHGFRLVEQRYADSYTVLRFRSPTPRRVSAQQLRRRGLRASALTSVILERSPDPGRGR